MRNRLISSLAGTAFSFVASGLAFAADMPVKAPLYKAPPPAPVHSWTGWYVGGNIGYGWARASADVNYFAPNSVGNPPGCGPAGSDLCINGSATVDMKGPIGGIQAGYNWQVGNYLAGMEADFQGTGQRGTRDFTTTFNTNLSVNGVTQGTAAISLTERIPWLGTVRGRLGYIANQWLVYGTGGVAYGRIEVDSSASATCISGALVPGTCPVWGFSGRGVTKIGWTVGGGAELALGGNWTARLEYLFVDLGSSNTTFNGLAGCFGVVVGINGSCVSQAAGLGTIHSRITDNIVRVGLNYQFH
jgi:outer membrane immunogenic protein